MDLNALDSLNLSWSGIFLSVVVHLNRNLRPFLFVGISPILRRG